MLAEPVVIIPAVAPQIEVDNWKDEPILDSNDELFGRRGDKKESMIPKFIGRPSGHQNIPPYAVRDPNPATFYLLFMNKDIALTFVESTNLYAAMMEVPNWKILTEKEFLNFTFIIIFMGVVKLPERAMYWQQDDYGQPLPRKLMSARRFEQIMANWHWVVVAENYRAQAKKEDPFYLVKGFVERLSEISQNYWKLGQFIDIDEMTIYYKGRHKCRCYNPSKPEKWHFKAFCLNDGDTGYLWNFYLYRGASEVREAGWSATAYPIKKLTSPFTKLYHTAKNYVMCTDNWYTSFEIAQYLWTKYRIHLIGTIKIIRSGIPKSRIYPEKGKNKKPRGTMNMAKTVIDGNCYYFTSWMDSRPVHGLSTLPTTKSMVARKMREGPEEPFRIIQIPRPDMWNWYNHGMGGTDLHDQFNKYYRTTVRCNKWPVRIFTHFITSAVTNAYILYKSYRSLETKDISLKTFIQEMLTIVTTDFDIPSEDENKEEVESDDSDSGSDYDDNNVPAEKKEYKKRKIIPNEVRLDNEKHYARQVKSKSGDKIRHRGGCQNCKAKVSTKCHKCDAFLCIDSTGDKTCFEIFHERAGLK